MPKSTENLSTTESMAKAYVHLIAFQYRLRCHFFIISGLVAVHMDGLKVSSIFEIQYIDFNTTSPHTTFPCHFSRQTKGHQHTPEPYTEIDLQIQIAFADPLPSRFKDLVTDSCPPMNPLPPTPAKSLNPLWQAFWLHELQKNPTFCSFGCKLCFQKCLFRNGKIEAAVRLHEDIMNGNIGLGFICKPNIVCYSILIANLCKDGFIKKAKELFLEMKCRRISPDVVVYTSLINGLVYSDNLDEAKYLFIEMMNEGISPSVMTFNLLVNVLCKEGKSNEASGLFELMVQRGEHVDSFSYNILMEGYCWEGKIDKARELYILMVDKGIEPDVRTHNVLINGYIKINRTEEAIRIFRQMTRSRKIKPTIVTYNALLTGVLKKGDVLNAQKLFDEMLHDLTPSSCTYNIMLNGLCKNDCVLQALDLLQTLENNGVVVLDIKAYNSVIDGLCKAGRMETAWDVYMKLSSKGLVPTVVTYSILIHGFCKTGQLTKVDDLFLEMLEKGCVPNAVTFNAFMRKFSRSDMSPKVIELLKKMVENKAVPDAFMKKRDQGWTHPTREVETRLPSISIRLHIQTVEGFRAAGSCLNIWLKWTSMRHESVALWRFNPKEDNAVFHFPTQVICFQPAHAFDLFRMFESVKKNLIVLVLSVDSTAILSSFAGIIW
ncbi:unnamed protein product [Lactuca saligna]|uniref:Pentatricopeptide repeat-containing protein n=1 Tax=Lactuca saligna TaxID=75948 RepID=A0AA35ZXC5_LACSI|nr:unnamed protein product [Lactuca saligna]